MIAVARLFGEMHGENISTNASIGLLMLEIWSNKEEYKDVCGMLPAFDKEVHGLGHKERLLPLFNLKEYSKAKKLRFEMPAKINQTLVQDVVNSFMPCLYCHLLEIRFSYLSLENGFYDFQW